MNTITQPITILAAMLALSLPAAPAQALNAKSWVANNGSEGNPCTQQLPCPSFQRAHDATQPGGEIGVNTPGDYGQVFITKSIHITNDSTGEASILATSGGFGVGIRINGGNGDVVSLRGLVMEGAVSGNAGLTFANASALHIQSCVIKNFEGNNGGLIFQPIGNSQLFVSDTIIFNNGSAANTGGIIIRPLGSGAANVVLDRLHLENNVVGLQLDATLTSSANGIHAILRDSVVSGNAGDGIAVITQAGAAPAFMLIDRGTSANNAASGISANGPRATILLKNSTITRNGSGVSTVNSGQLISYGNNRNNNNIGPEGAPTGFLSQM